jgi:CBS domain-containing protein
MGCQVRQYMTKHVNTIDDLTSVTDVTKFIAHDNSYSGYVVVLHNGQPVGMVTERDIVLKVVALECDPSTTPVSAIMSTSLHTIDPDEDLAAVAKMMREQDVRKLIVAKDNIIHGIITSKDISNKFQDYIDQSIRDMLRVSVMFNV